MPEALAGSHGECEIGRGMRESGGSLINQAPGESRDRVQVLMLP